MRVRDLFQITLASASLLVAGSEHATAQGKSTGIDFSQNYILKTVPLGFGGAYRALADSPGAILMNPAGIAQHRGEMSAGGEYIQSDPDSKLMSFSVVDFKATEMVALGVSYDRNTFTGGFGITVNQVTLTGATDLGGMLLIGANGKGYFTSVDSPFVEGPKGLDMDLGLIVKPIPMVSLAVTATNLFLGPSREEFPLQLGFGAGLTLGDSCRLAADLVKDFETTRANSINAYFGGELRMAEGVFLRGGFGLDQIRDDNFWSIGTSIAGPKISMNFTYSRQLNPTGNVFAAGVNFMF